jgi:Fic family protein
MRQRYRYDPISKQMVEVSSNYTRLERHEIQQDITPFVSPIDGTVISSRSNLREHMKRHDVVLADDYKEHREAKAKERQSRIAGTHPEVRAERIRNISESFERTRDERLAKGTWNRR